jgi:hypothetical protein
VGDVVGVPRGWDLDLRIGGSLFACGVAGAAASAHDVLSEMPAICGSPRKCRGLQTTSKATTRQLKELWAKLANECLERTSDEGRAIREAKTVVARQAEASY